MAIAKEELAHFNLQRHKEKRDAEWAAMLKELSAPALPVSQAWERVPLSKDAVPALYINPRRYPGRGMLIICAGGAFLYKSHMEARPVADFFESSGLNTCILDYRVDLLPDGNEDKTKPRIQGGKAAGEDGLAAIRYLRANAAKYGIPADKIAIGGFSAGGVLSGYAATRFDYGDETQVSNRPDAALLLYGAFSRVSAMANEAGKYDAALQNAAAKSDNVKNLRDDCPPFFIFQTHADDPRHCLNFAKELADRGIPFELHTFISGPHGGGLYNGKDDTPDCPHTAHWAALAADWLVTEQGF